MDKCRDRSEIDVCDGDLSFLEANETLLKESHRRLLKREPGALSGLFNEGSTCYLNSVIQCMLQCHGFSAGMVMESHLFSDDSVFVAVQRLFVRMIFSQEHAVKTIDLLKSFGWSKDQRFQQHDAHEFFSLLLGALGEFRDQVRSFHGVEHG